MRRLFVVIALFLSLQMTAVVGSQSSASAAVAAGCDGSDSFLLFPTWYKYLDIGPEGGDDCAVRGPTTTVTVNETQNGQSVAVQKEIFDWGAAAPRVGLAIVEILLRIGTLVAVGYVIYGGFRYITSQGEPDGARSARQTIVNALIGLVISLLATGIVAFIGNQLTSSSTDLGIKSPALGARINV